MNAEIEHKLAMLAAHCQDATRDGDFSISEKSFIEVMRLVFPNLTLDQIATMVAKEFSHE